MILRRTISPILFIVITGSDQVNVGTQVNKVLWVHSCNLLLFYSLQFSHAAGLKKVTKGNMDVASVLSIMEICMSNPLQLSEDEEKKISQNSLTSFSSLNSNHKGQISFLGNAIYSGLSQ